MPKSDVVVSHVKVRPVSDKMPFAGDVYIEGFGTLYSCPVWKKDGKFRPGLPMRKGEKQSFKLIELDAEVEHAVFAALILACEQYEERDAKTTASHAESTAAH